ncbi:MULTISPECIES: dTMP kinase [Helcococcus]|uniref:Thymidylate kinase n=1 Tax=Helcococcus bovis TaxID=3153252 RepID=A0ABW9F713_9FIRM
MRGKFIVFEGSDGSGKSTILEKVKKYLDDNKVDYIFTREPGGTKIGEQIRNILLNNDNEAMDDKTEALLFAAQRAQNVEEVIKKGISEGKLVISDRFVLSSLAYQGYARDLGVEGVKSINDFATGELKPDYTFFLDVDPITVLNRKRIAVKADRLEEEGNSFHERVYQGYKKLLDKNTIIIDASKSVEEVEKETLEKLVKVLEEK